MFYHSRTIYTYSARARYPSHNLRPGDNDEQYKIKYIVYARVYVYIYTINNIDNSVSQQRTITDTTKVRYDVYIRIPIISVKKKFVPPER